MSVPQQAAAIAIRRRGGAFEVCLIRKRESKKWGIPKGMIERGDTPEEAALNEAWEEAGVKGRLLGDAVGTYEYWKWARNFLVAVFVLEVLEEHAEWPEMGIRERRWTSFGDASLLLMKHPARPLLDRARAFLTNPGEI
jgi:8-oxo-dGTP pyrophosphatase MutT (NUDIX family)